VKPSPPVVAVVGPPVVVVVGPPLSGVDGVIAALRARLPGWLVIGADGAPALGKAAAIVAVVSAAAPMVRSDWALIERAAVGSDRLIGVVSKVDAHRAWRAVLDQDRMLADRWTTTCRGMPWVAVAAAPDLGEPRVDELVGLLRDHRDDADRAGMRNRRPVSGRGSSGADVVELRVAVQRTRLSLLGYARDRAAALRAELREQAASVSVGGADGFAAVVRTEAGRFGDDLDREITRAVQAAAAELGLDRYPPDGPAALVPRRQAGLDPPPSSSRRLEGRLMAVLGAGFGLGIALASSRLVAGLAPGLSIAGTVAGTVVGLGLVVWVVRVRGLLHDRALLDRWVTEVVATLRWHGETMVAERLIAAESRWSAVGRRRTPERVSLGAEYGLGDVTDQYEW